LETVLVEEIKAATAQAIHSGRNECACQFAGSGDPAYSGRL